MSLPVDDRITVEPTRRPAGSPLVLVVVVTHDSADLLPDLLASLPGGLEGLSWRVVVADNASSDDSVEVVRALDPSAVVVEMGRNAGYAAGINAAVAAATAATAFGSILVLNPDVRLARRCVPTLLDVLAEPDVGVAVPRLVDAGGRRIDSLRREPTLPRLLGDALVGARRAGRSPRWGEVVTGEEAYRSRTDTDWAEGSTLLISAECWRATGAWDEGYFLYSEETDFALRARDRGYRTRYEPAAGAVHLEGGSSGSVRLWPLLTVNRLRLYRRRRGPVRAVPFWAVLLLRELSRACLGHPASRAAASALLSPRRLRQARGPGWLR